VAIYRAQISFPYDSDLPRDRITITPHYSGSDPQALADALKTNLTAYTPISSSVAFNIKIYNAQGSPPHFPLAQANSTLQTPATSFLPRELALCFSYYGGFNRPRFRGRLYIPAMWAGGTAGARPTSTQRTNVANIAPRLANGLPSGTSFGVYSRRDNGFSTASNWWVDDEWDIVRSRGSKSTTRTTGTF
jgi:hypothetical protein